MFVYLNVWMCVCVCFYQGDVLFYSISNLEFRPLGRIRVKKQQSPPAQSAGKLSHTGNKYQQNKILTTYTLGQRPPVSRAQFKLNVN